MPCGDEIGRKHVAGSERTPLFFNSAPIVSFLMYLKATVADGYGRIGRVMSAYNDEKIYSVELVGAVCRALLSFEETS